MHQILGKLTNKLTLTLVGSLAVSVSLISALSFSAYAQNNSGNDNGNYPVRQEGNGNSVGGRGNTYNNRTNDNRYQNRIRNDNRYQNRIRNDNRYQNRSRNDNRYQQNTSCNGGNFRQSSCGSGSTVNNGKEQ
ncbi:hypothetical protein [Nostoc sp.]|uniref:hypothetical protein n=1 Tax=Nostoc sp. TaxID=1180 RepID=UPI002FFBDE11